MNKVLLVVCVVALICSVAASVNASPDSNWLVNIKAFNAAGTGNSNGMCQLGTGTNYIDGIKPGEDAYWDIFYPTTAYIYCVDLNPIMKWCCDRRQPATTEAKIWNLKLNVGAAFPDSQAMLKSWIGDLAPNSFQPSNDWSLTLQRKNGDSWDIVHTFNGDTGTESDPVFSTLVDVVPGTTYDYRLVYAPVPEPSSILALIAGLGGFGGIIWRRKK